MTDILLIQPPIRDFYLTAKRTIPYGLACLAGILREAGLSVEILDARTIRVDLTASTPSDYIRVLTDFSPGAVPEPATALLLGAGLVGAPLYLGQAIADLGQAGLALGDAAIRSAQGQF